jgi:hypothetical protein
MSFRSNDKAIEIFPIFSLEKENKFQGNNYFAYLIKLGSKPNI